VGVERGKKKLWIKDADYSAELALLEK